MVRAYGSVSPSEWERINRWADDWKNVKPVARSTAYDLARAEAPWLTKLFADPFIPFALLNGTIAQGSEFARQKEELS